MMVPRANASARTLRGYATGRIYGLFKWRSKSNVNAKCWKTWARAKRPTIS